MAIRIDNSTRAGERWDRIVPAMQRLVDSGEYPGMGLLVWQRGQVVFEEVVGQRDVEAGAPLQPDTLIRMYSMTKPIACAALMMLLEEGKFLLGDPVSRYLPAFGKVKVCAGMNAAGMRLVDPERAMTIRHLLTHTAGLSYGFLPDDPIDRLYAQAGLLDIVTYGRQSLEETVEKIAALPLRFHPGESYSYSVAHDVVGHLVAVLADMPFADFMKTRILAPLGMADTDFWVQPEQAHRLAALYTTGDDGQRALADTPLSSHLLRPPIAALGGMGLVSTPRDYLRFARMLLNGGELDGQRLLARQTVELMAANHLNPAQLTAFGSPEFPNQGYGYGLGLGVMMDRALNGSMRSNGSFGWGGAAGTECIIDPQEELVLLVETQRLMAPYPHNVLLTNLVYQAIE